VLYNTRRTASWGKNAEHHAAVTLFGDRAWRHDDIWSDSVSGDECLRNADLAVDSWLEY
jgi:hypothetical protein